MQKIEDTILNGLEDFHECVASVGAKLRLVPQIKMDTRDVNMKVDTLFETIDEFREEIKALTQGNEEYFEDAENLDKENIKFANAYVEDQQQVTFFIR